MTSPSATSRVVLVLGMLGGFSAALGLEGRAGAQSQPNLASYAVVGLEAVQLGADVRVQPGAVGTMAGTVRLAVRARVPGTVVADSVRVARGARAGRLFCGLVFGGAFGPGVVGGPTVGGSTTPAGCLQLTKPVLDPALLAPVSVTPGTADLTVPARTGSAPTGPGAYGAVVVGRGSLLQLSGGTYQMRSIRLARTARLVCLDDCRIGVAETVTLRRRAQLGAASGLVQADKVRLDVTPGAVAPAFRTAPRAIVAATVFAPGGSVVLGPDGDYRGAFVGLSVKVGARSRVREASAFPPPPRQPSR